MNELASSEGYELFRQWSLYERVVRFNHMRHQEIGAATCRAVGELSQPLKILDLGSGAGEFARDVLKQAAVLEYVGIDLSADAIAQLLLQGTPGTLGADVQMTRICGEMLEELRHLPSGRFDLVLASYSLHHFPGPQKVPVLKEIARVVEPGGAFIWIDLLCREGESAEQYLARTCERIRREWVGLSPEERESTCTHALGCDYPEQASAMQRMVAGSSLSLGKLLYRDEFYGGWLFQSAKTGG